MSFTIFCVFVVCLFVEGKCVDERVVCCDFLCSCFYFFGDLYKFQCLVHLNFVGYWLICIFFLHCKP